MKTKSSEPEFPTATYDATGTWVYSESDVWVNPGNAGCTADPPETEIITVTQTGNTFGFVDDEGTISGTVSDATYTYAYSYSEDGGTTSVSGTVTLSSCSSGSGTSSWSWQSGSYYCSGGDSITITRQGSCNTGNGEDDGWTDISGTVRNEEGTPLCAMVLANGQHMFSCGENDGKYALRVPLDENGEITLFCFCEGLVPFKAVLTPAEAASFDVTMSPALPDNPTMILTYESDFVNVSNSGWVRISGEVSNAEGVPLCAMVLINGQHMFSCGESNGKYDMEVPLDANGEVTLFGFCEGLQPFKETLIP